MINTYNLFELKQTQKFKLLKIFLAYNIETDRNYLIKDFFYHITQFGWIVSQNFWDLHETTEAMDIMRSLFHYYTQITPLENGGHTLWMDYKQIIPKFAQNHWGNGFYEVPFPLLHTNHHLGKQGPHSLNGLQATNSEICTKPQK